MILLLIHVSHETWINIFSQEFRLIAIYIVRAGLWYLATQTLKEHTSISTQQFWNQSFILISEQDSVGALGTKCNVWDLVLITVLCFHFVKFPLATGAIWAHQYYCVTLTDTHDGNILNPRRLSRSNSLFEQLIIVMQLMQLQTVKCWGSSSEGKTVYRHFLNHHSLLILDN